MADKLGKAVYSIEVDTKTLKPSLNKARLDIDIASKQMVRSLDKVKTSTLGTSDAMQVLEKAAAATGLGWLSQIKNIAEFTLALGRSILKIGASTTAIGLDTAAINLNTAAKIRNNSVGLGGAGSKLVGRVASRAVGGAAADVVGGALGRVGANFLGAGTAVAGGFAGKAAFDKVKSAGGISKLFKNLRAGSAAMLGSKVENLDNLKNLTIPPIGSAAKGTTTSAIAKAAKQAGRTVEEIISGASDARIAQLKGFRPDPLLLQRGKSAALTAAEAGTFDFVGRPAKAPGAIKRAGAFASEVANSKGFVGKGLRATGKGIRSAAEFLPFNRLGRAVAPTAGKVAAKVGIKAAGRFGAKFIPGVGTALDVATIAAAAKVLNDIRISHNDISDQKKLQVDLEDKLFDARRRKAARLAEEKAKEAAITQALRDRTKAKTEFIEQQKKEAALAVFLAQHEAKALRIEEKRLAKIQEIVDETARLHALNEADRDRADRKRIRDATAFNDPNDVTGRRTRRQSANAVFENALFNNTKNNERQLDLLKEAQNQLGRGRSSDFVRDTLAKQGISLPDSQSVKFATGIQSSLVGSGVTNLGTSDDELKSQTGLLTDILDVLRREKKGSG